MGYDELIESIDKHSGITMFDYAGWAKENAPDIGLTESNIIKHILDMALSDTSAWYAKDVNGERIHFGDEVRIEDEPDICIVEGFRLDYGVLKAILANKRVKHKGYATRCNFIEKVKPDSRQSLIEEIADWGYSKDDPDTIEKVEAWLERYDHIKEVEE